MSRFATGRFDSGSNVAAPVAAWEQAVAFTSGLIGSVMHDGMLHSFISSGLGVKDRHRPINEEAAKRFAILVEVSSLPNRGVVLVVDDDAAKRRSVARLLTATPSQGGGQFCAGHLHDWERQPCRSHVCASVRPP